MKEQDKMGYLIENYSLMYNLTGFLLRGCRVLSLDYIAKIYTLKSKIKLNIIKIHYDFGRGWMGLTSKNQTFFYFIVS